MGTWMEEGPPVVAVVTVAALYSGVLFLTDGTWISYLYLLFLFFPAWEDGMTGEISDGWTWLLALTGLATAFHAGRLAAGLTAAGLMLLLYGVLYWISKGGVGSGDVFLAAAASLWLTPLSSFLALWLSCLAAILYAGISWLRGHTLRGVRFVPFMALGGGVAYAAAEMALWPALRFPFS